MCIRDSVSAERLRTAPTETPWFMSVGFSQTHRDFDDCDPSLPGQDPRYVRPPAPVPDTAATRRDMACYANRARLVDTCYGEVLAGLAASGQADRTIVICTTDHGIAFPDMKCRLTHHGTGVAPVSYTHLTLPTN